MSRKPTEPPNPGETGEWFLDVVSPTAEMPTVPTGQLTSVTPASFEPPPPLRADPGRVDLFDPIDDTFTHWEPTEMSATYQSKRTWRWPVILGSLVIAGVLGTIMWWAPGFIETRIDDRRQEFSEGAQGLQSTLPAVAEAIGPVTGPDSTAALTAINAIAGLQNAAARLEEVILSEHPPGLPFVGLDPATELEPLRDRAARLAPSGEALGRRLTDAVTYRTIADDAFVLPELPTSADSATISALSVALSTALADTVGIASALPTDPAFGPHDAYLDAAINRFETWQAEYLDALRREDEIEAGGLVDEIEAAFGGLEAALVDSLEGLAAELRQHVTDLDRETVEVQILAGS